MPLHSTEAIVVGGTNLGEADRIVAFFTRASGKVRAVAEGARRIRSRFGGGLELFTRGRLVYFERPNKTLHRVNEFAILESHRRLREDLDLLAHGSYVVELASSSVEDGQPSPDLYQLLDLGLGALDRAEVPVRLLLRAVELQVLRCLGYLPELQACVGCRQALGEEADLALSPDRGGLLCPDCQGGARELFPLSVAAVGFLRGAARADPLRAARALLPDAAAAEVEAALGANVAYTLGRRLRSVDFLARL